MARRDVRSFPAPVGEGLCLYGKSKSECSKLATRHFMWLDTKHITNACDEHAEWLRTHSINEMEEHRFGDDCGMPGALWHHPYEDEEDGYCFFPMVDDASILSEEVIVIKEVSYATSIER